MADGTKTILVVDDDKTITLMVSSYLRHGGWTVHTATSPMEALTAVADNRYSVVVTDLQLGTAMDGLSLFKEMRTRQPFLRGILMSAYINFENILHVMETGFDDCLLKPVKNEQLLTSAQHSYDISAQWSDRIVELRKKSP